MSFEKAPLNEEEKLECARLKAAIAAFNENPGPGGKISQERAAGVMGMTQGAYSSFLNGKTRINNKVVVGVMKVYGIHVSQYSQRLTTEINELCALLASATPQPVPITISLSWDALNSSLKALQKTSVLEAAALITMIEHQRRLVELQFHKTNESKTPVSD